MANWGIGAFSRPPYGIVFKLEAEGVRNGADATLAITVRHEDGYALTAIPTVACLLQYLDGGIGRSAGETSAQMEPGLHLMALAVEPDRLLRDMTRMGADVGIHPDSARLGTMSS